jgi:hypothetical protein
VQVDPQRSENGKTLEPTNACQAALAEASRDMTNEGCPNEASLSVPDAIGSSGADDAEEQ